MTLANPISVVTPLSGTAAARRAQILAALRAGKSREAYRSAYSLFLDETGIRLPQPPNAGTSRRLFYRKTGRDFARLPRMEREEIVVRFYQFLKSMAPDFRSDRESIPLWVRVLSGLIPLIAWFNALETAIAGVWHDFSYHVGASAERARLAQLRHDETFLQHTIDFIAFASPILKPLYLIAAPVRYAAVRVAGHRHFRIVEVEA